MGNFGSDDLILQVLFMHDEPRNEVRQNGGVFEALFQGTEVELEHGGTPFFSWRLVDYEMFKFGFIGELGARPPAA